MANFAPLYTGRDSAAKFPELDALTRSTQRSQELAMKGEEMKLNKALKDKDAFQKMLSIDPVTAVSTANATRQAVELEKYNAKWAKRYADREGKLTFSDEIEMTQDKSLLQAQQKKILADQEQFLNAQETIARDTRGYYDRNNFERAKQQYYESGELPPNMLDVAPQSVTGWLRSKVKDLPYQTVPKVVNGVRVDQKVIDPKDAQLLLLEGMTDESVLKGVLRDFNALPESKQLEIVGDYNGDGKVDPADSKYAYEGSKIESNPIVQWALNNPSYLEVATGTKEGASKGISGGSTAFKWDIGINANNNRNNKFEVYKNRRQSFSAGESKLFPDYLNLGAISQGATEPQNIDEYIKYDASGKAERISTKEEDVWENGKKTGKTVKKPLGESARLNIIAYSPTEDVIVVEIADDGSEQFSKGDKIALPADKYNDLLSRKPFGIDRASLRSGMPSVSTTETAAQRAMRQAKENASKGKR